MKSLFTLSTIIFALIFTSCDETKKVIDVAGSVQLTGSYTVSDLNGKKLAVKTKPTFTMSALDNSFRGTTGCNSVFGSYTIDLYAINFSNIGVSEMFCAEESVMNTERDFLDALNNTGSYTIQDSILTLFSKTDKSVLLSATKDSKTEE